ncbi:glycosyltransferase family 2 protein [Comamonas sp.]|uniref:glycosyltransferase family 2 protein n=1 Tax=Comamonas sp. TaxID=34028 RepID=UPI002FC65E04
MNSPQSLSLRQELSFENLSDVSLDISIVTYNSFKWLAKFFDSLASQRIPLKQIRLLVRDNGSTDGSIAWLQNFQQEQQHNYLEISVEAGANVGFGKGHNANLAKAQSPFFLVTNVDLEFEPDTLVELLIQACADGPDVAQWECRQKPYEHPKHYNPVNGDVLWCSSACALFRTEAMRKVGGYEPLLFMYGEDVELSYRLRDNGYRLRYVPKATVWHYTYEEAAQVKPMQFLGSTYANVLLRCRYGSRHQVIGGAIMYLGLLAVPQSFPGQRRGLLKNGLKLLRSAPVFLRTRRKSHQPFPFRLWDYEMPREGSFHAYPEKTGDEPKPLVSVLTRTTPGKTGRLAEAVASVAAQTYSNIQLVVVEDGGNTAQAFMDEVRGYGVLSEVTYLPLPKMGRCAAGNAALAAARGELLCFLDDDDLFYADHLEVLVDAWQKRPELGAVYSLAYQVRTEVISAEPWIYREIEHSLLYRQQFNRYVMWHHNYLPIQTVLFKRSLFEQYGGFDPDLENLEDWNLWVRYSLHHDFEMVHKVTSLYRVPAKAEMAVGRQKMLDDYYAKAQEKHAQLRADISPVEVLSAAQQLSRDIYVTLIPAKQVRKFILQVPSLRWLYHPLRKFAYYVRRVRNR